MKAKKWSCTPCGERHDPSRMKYCPVCTAWLCPDCQHHHPKEDCLHLRKLLAICESSWKDDLALT